METFTNHSAGESWNNKSEKASKPSEIATAFFVIALFLVLVLNVLGNSMVLYVVHHQWKNIKQRVTNSLIANLACIDLLAAILVFFSIIIAIRGNSGLTYTKCQIDGFLSTLVGTASIPTMAVIAIDRYLVIVLSPGHRLKLRAARVIIACVWIMSIAVSLSPILFWGKYHRTKKSTQCKNEDRSFLLFLAIVFFVIPLVTMVFCYVNVFLKVNRHQQTISTLKAQNCSIKTEFRTTKIVFTVLATFIVLWTPYVAVYVTSSNRSKDSIPAGVFKFCGFLTAMHSMCNPIIYFTMNRSFRRTAIKLLREIFSCVLPANEDSAASDSVSGDQTRSAIVNTLQASRQTVAVQVSTNELSIDSRI